MYGLLADRSLCVDSVGLLRHWWRCRQAGVNSRRYKAISVAA
jgi:hypothetical protein